MGDCVVPTWLPLVPLVILEPVPSPIRLKRAVVEGLGFAKSASLVAALVATIVFCRSSVAMAIPDPTMPPPRVDPVTAFAGSAAALPATAQLMIVACVGLPTQDAPPPSAS